MHSKNYIHCNLLVSKYKLSAVVWLMVILLIIHIFVILFSRLSRYIGLRALLDLVRTTCITSDV